MKERERSRGSWKECHLNSISHDTSIAEKLEEEDVDAAKQSSSSSSTCHAKRRLDGAMADNLMERGCGFGLIMTVIVIDLLHAGK